MAPSQHSAPDLYFPVDTAEDLQRLRTAAAGRRSRYWRAAALAGFASLIFIAVNLATTGLDSRLPPSARWWSLFPVLTLALAAAAWAAVELGSRGRALEAQRRQLLDRGLLGRESEIQVLEAGLERRLKALSPRRPELEGMLQEMRESSGKLLESLNRIEAAAGRRSLSAAERDQHEETAAVLDAYRVSLGILEVDVLLQPDAFRSDAARNALDGALALLEQGAERESRIPAEVSSRSQARHSIAVLPFADMSPERDQEYFGAGLAEELINALTKIEGLRVIARSSAFSFQAGQRDLREIGHKLDVDTVLEGSIRRSGHRVRITVQLVRVSDGLHLWSQRYDRDLNDVFSVQDGITSSVIEHVKGELLTEPLAPRPRVHTESVEAYHLYLKGRHFCARRSPADLRESIDLFERAIARDPGYALAYAGVADSFNLLGYYSVLSPAKAFPRAKEAATQALRLDETLAEAHLSLAFARVLYDWDWQGAEEEFRRTFELNPGYATAHHWFAEYLAFLGRHDEAIEQAKTALALDPLSLIINVLMGWTLYYGRRYDEAVETLHETLELDPNFAPAHFWLGLSCEQQGRYEDALASLQSAVDYSNRSPMMLAALGRLYAHQGDRDKKRQVLAELQEEAESAYVPAYYVAAIHSGSGDAAQTLSWLERACQQRDNWMVFLNIDPIWDPYRGERRFRTLLAQVGL